MFNASLPAALSLVVLLAQALPGQQPRDAPPPSAKAGTAAIRGRVFNLETGLPIRRASVMLMAMHFASPALGRWSGGSTPCPGPSPSPASQAGRGGGSRAVRTDQAGRFEFTGLTAGTYRLRVSPNQNTGAYLAAAYGASDSREPGKVIELKEGQQFDTADVPLQRGGAVAGRVIDDSGDPLSRVNVYASRATPGGQGFQRTGGSRHPVGRSRTLSHLRSRAWRLHRDGGDPRDGRTAGGRSRTGGVRGHPSPRDRHPARCRPGPRSCRARRRWHRHPDDPHADVPDHRHHHGLPGANRAARQRHVRDVDAAEDSRAMASRWIPRDDSRFATSCRASTRSWSGPVE